MATISSLYVGVLYVQYAGNGWSEKYNLIAATQSDAMADFKKICLYRSTILAPGCTITWARVSLAGQPRDARAVLDAPVESYWPDPAAPDDVQFPDAPFTGVQFRFETQIGKWGNRIFRGIPDDAIGDDLFLTVYTPPPGTDTLPATPAAGAAYDVCLTHAMNVILAHSQYASPLTVSPRTWDAQGWVKAIFRKVASRKTGRPFGTSAGRAPSV